MRRVIGNDYVTSLDTVFTLKLPENPTTGYSWQLTLSPGLQIVSDSYQSAQSNGMVGAGGTHIWRIEAIAPGLQTVRGIYKRPWEQTVGNEKTYSMNIMVLQ